MNRLAFAALLVAGVVCWTNVDAQDVPDCYAPKELTSHRPRPNLSVAVLLDDTTLLNSELQKAVSTEIKRFIRKGAELHIFRFSAFVDGRYTSRAFSASFASPLPEGALYDIRKPVAKSFERCMEIQVIRANQAITAILQRYFSDASSSISKSEIVAAVRDLGDNVALRMAAQKRVLLMVSDMLENSELTSFYLRGGVRKIDPAAELAKVGKASLFTNLVGMNVYVIGAGVLPVDQKGGSALYRDEATMAALRDFWKQYLERSSGTLREFGQPLLLAPIGP